MYRVLIVEDDEAIANLIKINLTAEGYDCVVAYDGEVGADYDESGKCIYSDMETVTSRYGVGVHEVGHFIVIYGYDEKGFKVNEERIKNE